MAKKLFWISLLFFVSLIPMTAFLGSDLPLTHDGQDHAARIANFYQNLAEGNLIPRWAGNLNWGYGHPVLMFLYPLPSYFASIFHFLGFSFVDSTKIVFGLGFVLSGLTMYWWIRELFDGRDLPAFAAGLLYLFAPYRFVNLYVRGAIGENFFFIWPPLVLYFLLKLSNNFKWKYIAGGALSLAAMILSHNALSLMFLPFMAGYGIILVLINKNWSLVIHYLLFVILGFGVSAFFWLPAFFEGKYTLRDIVTQGEYAGRFETWRRLVWSPWNFGGTGAFSGQLGVLQWLTVLAAPALIYWMYKRDKTDKACFALLLLSLATFLMAVFLILPLSRPFYETFTILQKFQFPWRWLSLAIFPPAIFAGALICALFKKYRLFAVGCLLLAVLALNKDYWQPKDYLVKPEAFYTGIYYGTTDTGESAPIWSVRFMLEEPKARLEIIEGMARINELERTVTHRSYRINVESEKARLVENTLYFPGWFVFVDGEKTEIEFQDPDHRGLMTFWAPRGKHEVVVNFQETKLRMFANIVSGGSLLALAVLSVAVFFKKR